MCVETWRRHSKQHPANVVTGLWLEMCLSVKKGSIAADKLSTQRPNAGTERRGGMFKQCLTCQYKFIPGKRQAQRTVNATNHHRGRLSGGLLGRAEVI